MFAESNPNIYTPYSTSRAIWCSFGRFEHGSPPGSNFAARMLVRVALFYWESCSYILPRSPRWPLTAPVGLMSTSRKPSADVDAARLRWHCSTVWVLLALLCQVITCESIVSEEVCCLVIALWLAVLLRCRVHHTQTRWHVGQLSGNITGRICDYHLCCIKSAIQSTCVMDVHAYIYIMKLKVQYMQILGFKV